MKRWMIETYKERGLEMAEAVIITGADAMKKIKRCREGSRDMKYKRNDNAMMKMLMTKKTMKMHKRVEVEESK